MKRDALRQKLPLLIIAFLLMPCLLLPGCKGDPEETEKTEKSHPDAAPLSGEDSPSSTTEAAPLITLTAADIPEIEAYISSCVNGPFREYTEFPDFIAVQQLPLVIFSGSQLLLNAAEEVGTDHFSRSNYEQLLQENFNPDITLPLNADYVLAYDKESDSFRSDYEIDLRNFTPSSFWLDPELSQEGQDIYYDAYEFNYEYVNAESGREERENPIARMVVDEVTVGFSAPIVRKDLHLIDHRPLAKTRYTLRLNKSGGYYMVSKTKLSRDAAYKASAAKEFNDVKARTGSAFRLGGNRLNIRDWASDDAQIIGTLEEGTWIWFVDPLPTTGFYLGAPAALYDVFDYSLGFGFMHSQYVG